MAKARQTVLARTAAKIHDLDREVNAMKLLRDLRQEFFDADPETVILFLLPDGHAVSELEQASPFRGLSSAEWASVVAAVNVIEASENRSTRRFFRSRSPLAIAFENVLNVEHIRRKREAQEAVERERAERVARSRDARQHEQVAVQHLCVRCSRRPRRFDDLCKRCANEAGARPKGKIT